MTDNDLNWRKSSRCGEAGQCVEIAISRDEVLVRRADQPAGPVLRFSHSGWLDLISGIKAGGFDSGDHR
jgi:uncharacterized protein DUF397